MLMSHFREKDGTLSCRYSSGPLAHSALSSTLDDRWPTLAFPLKVTMEEHRGGGCSLRQGPVSNLSRDPVAKEEARRGFLRRARICIYILSRLPGQQQHPAKPTCVARTVLLLPESNWRSFVPPTEHILSRTLHLSDHSTSGIK